jgi:hypothetical protein
MLRASERLRLPPVRAALPRGTDLSVAVLAAQRVLDVLQAEIERPGRAHAWARRLSRKPRVTTLHEVLTQRSRALDVALHEAVVALVEAISALNHLDAEQSDRLTEHDERLAALTARVDEVVLRVHDGASGSDPGAA